MPLTPELVQQLTPQTPGPGEPGLAKEHKIEDPGRLRRLAWTRFLRSKDFFFKKIKRLIPDNARSWHLGVGLVPTLGFSVQGPKEMMPAIEESRYTWGIILNTDAFAEPQFIEHLLDFDALSFPIIASPSGIELHHLTLGSGHNWAVGSRTAWAVAKQTHNSASSKEGLLTARHVPDRCHQAQLWSNEANCTFTEYRRGSNYVDASYLDGSWGSLSPKSATPKSVDLMAAGDQVTLRGAYTTSTGFITHTPNPHYVGGGTASHVFLSTWGDNGDSGGLIDEPSAPISMYLGKSTLRDGSFEGISLSLEQVVRDLEIDILF